MGIRYLAISIDAIDYEHLEKGPCPTCGESPRLRELDGEEEERRKTLDLDKSWGYLQGIFSKPEKRLAFQLVAGQVTNTPWGWKSYQGLLDPAAVRAIAEDLNAVTLDDVQEYFAPGGVWSDEPGARDREDCDYVGDYLKQAREFVSDVAKEGRSITYFIG